MYTLYLYNYLMYLYLNISTYIIFILKNAKKFICHRIENYIGTIIYIDGIVHSLKF